MICKGAVVAPFLFLLNYYFMAFQGKNIFDCPNGKIGNLMYYKRKGIPVVQSIGKKPNNGNNFRPVTIPACLDFIWNKVISPYYSWQLGWDNNPVNSGGVESNFRLFNDHYLNWSGQLNCTGMSIKISDLNDSEFFNFNYSSSNNTISVSSVNGFQFPEGVSEIRMIFRVYNLPLTVIYQDSKSVFDSLFSLSWLYDISSLEANQMAIVIVQFRIGGSYTSVSFRYIDPLQIRTI